MNDDLISRSWLLEQYGLKDCTKYGNETAEQKKKSYDTMMMYEIAEMIKDAPTVYDMDKIKKALQEIKNFIHIIDETNKCDEYRKENEKYHEIGTIEECKKAREKQKAKKPIKYRDTRQGLDNDGNSISWQEDCYECPTCESFLGYVSDCEDENYQDNYCQCCGQAIEWY